MRPSNDRIYRRALLATGFAALAVLGACADAKPFEYREISEIQDGPGLLSGEDGAFVFTFD